MLRDGIIVRHIEGRMVRVTIGLEEENKEFLTALKRVIHSH
jgi:histidinol-phosphate aminotransferase